MGRALRACVILLVAAGFAAGCTVKKTDPPALVGPSELGLSLSLGANPDVIYQDGRSQSMITIQAGDANGKPVGSLVLRLDLSVDGVPGDVGVLTTKSPVTGSDGRAVVTYTSPLVTDGSSHVVAVSATPVGTNYANNATPRSVQIRLVPTGGVPPVNDLVAGFSVTPEQPTIAESALFNASACATTDQTGCTRGSIVGYAWDFGDGSTGSGQVTSHIFNRAGNYAVTLTVTGGIGQTTSTTQIVQVQAGTPPTANFVFSPTSPVAGQDVYFNGGSSTAGTGRTIVTYQWDFGPGGALFGSLVKYAFAAPGTYVITLTVTDDIGQKGTKSTNVTIR
jgi:PKD repeat protein